MNAVTGTEDPVSVEPDRTGRSTAEPGQTTDPAATPWSRFGGVLVTLGVIAATQILSSTAFPIPNPGPVFLIAVVYATYTGGIGAGLISAVLTLLYYAWFFAIPGEPLHYTQDNLGRILVLLVISPAMVLMVGALKHCSRLLKKTATTNEALRAQIAERETMEENLRLAACVFENAQEGVMVTDAANTIVAVNPAFTRITGYNAAEAIGNDPRLLSSKRQDGAFYKAMWASIAETGRWEGDIWNRRKDGEVFCEWLSIGTVKNAKGEFTHHIGIFTDVTGPKKSQQELQESKERLRCSQAYANIGSWDRNIQTGEVYWSERIGPLLGYAEGELEATYPNFLNAVHPEDLQYVMDSAKACVNGGGDYDIEHRVIWPDGTVRWLQQRGNMIRGDDGCPMRMLGVAQDITDRKQAEEALRESETRFRQLAENIREVFWIKDTAKDRILYVSPAYEHIWGRKLNDFDEAYRSFRESIHPEDRQQLFASMQAQRQGTGEEATEYRIVRPDGAVRWIRSRSFPIRDSSGMVYRIVGIAEDTTDVKNAEEVRLAHAVQQRNAHAVQQRNALVKEVHHRIKNNLQAVAGLLMHEAHKHPELEPLLTAMISQVQLIAVVHGIQANAANQGIFVCEMTLAIARIVESLTHSHFKVNVEIAMPCPVQISEKESVPVALVLNELLINAVKHLSGNAEARGIEVTICRFRDTIQVIIFNQGSLPEGFDFDAGIGTGTGLGLVRSLMPRRGAELSLRGSSDGVEAVLKLSAPVIEV